MLITLIDRHQSCKLQALAIRSAFPRKQPDFLRTFSATDAWHHARMICQRARHDPRADADGRGQTLTTWQNLDDRNPLFYPFLFCSIRRVMERSTLPRASADRWSGAEVGRTDLGDVVSSAVPIGVLASAILCQIANGEAPGRDARPRLNS